MLPDGIEEAGQLRHGEEHRTLDNTLVPGNPSKFLNVMEDVAELSIVLVPHQHSLYL